ncbi:MAG: methyltransferase family protein [Pseudomonadota bacterium]
MVDEFAPDPMDAPKAEADKPAVKIHPPTVLFAALVSGYIIRLFVGGRLPLPRAFAEGLGGLLIIVALGLMMMAIRIFVEQGQPLRPATPAKELFQKGPYRFTRNPLYLAMMLFGAGFGVATSNVWIIITTAAAGGVIHFLAILPEEAYLKRKFGEEYAAYKAKVRRWL